MCSEKEIAKTKVNELIDALHENTAATKSLVEKLGASGPMKTDINFHRDDDLARFVAGVVLSEVLAQCSSHKN